MDIAALSGPKLLAHIKQCEREARAATAAAIAYGLGNVRFNEMRERSLGGCPIAWRVVETWTAEGDAKRELDARRNYHGGDSPIRSAA